MTVGRRTLAHEKPYDHAAAVAWLTKFGASGGTCIDVSHVGQGTLPQSFFSAAKAAGITDVIIKAGGADDGLYKDLAHDLHAAEARAAGLNVGHYMFNGRAVSLQAFADAFVAYAAPRTGDTMWTDVEGETGMAAFTPGEVLTVHAQVRTRGLPTPGTYLNQGEILSGGWGPVRDDGSPLWEAAYISGPPNTGPWPGYVWWQYTDSLTVGGVHVDGSIRGNQQPNYVGAAPAKPKRSNMSNVVSINEWGQAYLVSPGFVEYLGKTGTSAPDVAIAVEYNSVDHTNIRGIGVVNVPSLLAQYGLEEFTAAQLQNLPSAVPPRLVASWNRASSLTLADGQITSLAQQVAADLPDGITPAQVESAVTAALANLDLQITGDAKVVTK